mgnify:CR=1 FL=1
MELRDYIEIGSEKAGSLTALGKKLDLSQPNMSHAKAMKKALPIDAAMKLADYIGADLRSVIAANELVTEKKEEKKNYWMQFVKSANAAIMIVTLGVTNFVTPSPAEAAPLTQTMRQIICIMLNNGRTALKQRKLLRFLCAFLKNARQFVIHIVTVTFPTTFKLWIFKI